MNPHEFLALTPGTNCGECGQPTCLAFAVAVTRGGAAPSACPHLDQASLPEELREGTGQGGLDRVERGQDERDMALVAHLKSRIRDLDFRALARKIGAEWRPDGGGCLVFSYLGRPVTIDREQVVMGGGRPVDPRDQILLYNYLAFGGGDPPAGEWVGMESLPNSISKVRTLATYCEQRLADRFAGRSRILAELCARIDGRPGPADQSADVGMVIPVLPWVPLYLLFWDEDPDDGFAARVKILFDHQVMDFLDLESLVFAAERLADRLAELDRDRS